MIITSNLDAIFSFSKSFTIKLIFKLFFFACIFATFMFSLIKSIPVTVAPILVNPSETKPPPHPISSISVLFKFSLFKDSKIYSRSAE